MNIPQEMILKQIGIGPMANYAYFIGDAENKDVGIVDPGWDSKEIIKTAQKENYNIIAILLTHGHFDHITEVDNLAANFNCPVYISKQEYAHLNAKTIIKVNDHDKIKIGKIDIECVLTPGHTTGSQCFKYKNVLLTGDTLFLQGCGRCDLPGGNPKEMYHSLYNVLMRLPDDTIIFPGHAYSSKTCSTIAEQKKTNPYLMCKSEKEFLEDFMG